MVVETVKGKMSSTWWLVLLQGIAVLILGILLLAAPEMTITVLIQFLGAFFLKQPRSTSLRALVCEETEAAPAADEQGVDAIPQAEAQAADATRSGDV